MTTRITQNEIWTRLFPGIPPPENDGEMIWRLAIEIEALRALATTEQGIRPALEIHRAHDLLAAVALQAAMRPAVPLDGRDAMFRHLDALCWVLGHEHNTAVAELLARVEAWMQEHGIELRLLPGSFQGRTEANAG